MGLGLELYMGSRKRITITVVNLFSYFNDSLNYYNYEFPK